MKSRKILIISLIVLTFFTFSKTVQANEEKSITVIKKSNESFNADNQISEDNEIYNLVKYEKKELQKESKIETHISDEKEFETNDEDFLRENFDPEYIFEDEKYQGTLPLKDFNIITVDRGYTERIDQKEISLSNMPTNDLEQVEKEKQIGGRTYYLISVDWEVEKSEKIDEITIPKSYKGTAYYQTIIRTNNPSTYKVTANYEGIVYEKEGLISYTAFYEKEEKINLIGPIASIFVVFTLGLLFYLFKPNVFIYNVIENQKIKRIKMFRFKESKIVDITSPKIQSNKFIVIISKGTYEKIKGKELNLKLNNQLKTIVITENKKYFYI